MSDSSASLGFSTCDLCDAHISDDCNDFRVLPPVFHSYGGNVSFMGEVSTVQCLDDNSLVRAALAEPGGGRVLVVDGGGSLRRALVGGNVATSAAQNGWAGVLVYGCVRDVAELKSTPVGLYALALNPMPTVKQGQGLRDVYVQIAGLWIRPGDWLYADADGIVLSRRNLLS
ncbi:ribonuclease E activity regulator RraA [Comamonas sp. NyZ500]|uniref:ribonuclease E activity regulator RraA n=1 Tax=Comamonas sp. NyZ500 TaxID=2795732 RepID=UPI00192CB377|nr:ribonuclease E activity regulator RraA [Comamonas sp. NyZ500]MBL5980407.1 ribonuclease E activity regulator RraA [Comamonas sp. NyZ500]